MTGLATTTPPAAVDGVFRALSDPTRRSVLERLTRGPSSVSELAAPFEMALPSFVAHMKTLERAGLVPRGRRGVCAPILSYRNSCVARRTGSDASAAFGRRGWISSMRISSK